MTECEYFLPDLDASGDNLYGPRVCWQPFIDWAWEVFDFDPEDWDHGFGYEDVCDNSLPLCRTLSGIWCLQYSADDYTNESYDSNILQWGCRFVRNAIDELDARCGTGDAFARTQDAGLFEDSWTQLYLDFFYIEEVSLRAGTLIHEARHASGVKHDSGDNDSSWEYNGAWKWQVCWLSWFAAHGTRTSDAMKKLAKQRANNILNSKFDIRPTGADGKPINV